MTYALFIEAGAVITDAELDRIKSVGAAGILVEANDEEDFARLGARCSERGLRLHLRVSMPEPIWTPITQPTRWQRLRALARRDRSSSGE